jgi:hypothetical protein
MMTGKPVPAAQRNAAVADVEPSKPTTSGATSTGAEPADLALHAGAASVEPTKRRSLVVVICIPFFICDDARVAAAAIEQDLHQRATEGVAERARQRQKSPGSMRSR